LTIARPIPSPSFAVGTLGGRLENEADRDDEILNAEETASIRRVLDRLRYSDSNGPTARKINDVSGLVKP
jgi:hypothetical protein